MLTKEQIHELENLSKPLIDWINKNANPHTKLLIDTTSFELLDGVFSVYTTEFVSD